MLALPMLTPEKFWTTFSTNLQSKWNNQVGECYRNDTKWTNFLSQFLVELGKAQFDFHVIQEYWPRIDIAYFDRACPNWDEWSLEVAIEYENGDEWTDELCKLMLINAGLKVLIAYSHDRNLIDEKLNRLPKIQKSRKYSTVPSSWLLIFGPHSGGNFSDFIAYKFDGQKVTDITGASKIITSATR